MATTVSRRIVFVKVKHQLPKLSAPTEEQKLGMSVGRRNVTAVLYGELQARPKAKSWWRKPWVMLGLAVAIVAAAGLALIVSRKHHSIDDELNDYATPRAEPGRFVKQNAAGRPTNAGATEGVTIDYAKRSPPTDSSFLATPFSRRKAAVAALPDNVSGKCVVTGVGPGELDNCLSRHGGK